MDEWRALNDLAAGAARLIAQVQGEPPAGGSLSVVGTGIRALTQLDVETLALLSSAEVLLHVIGEPVQERAVAAINPAARTMTDLYADGGDRGATYEAMVRRMVEPVLAGRRTVAAFYGHPGVFTYPTHEAVRRVRAAGFPARMLPAVSAADCLYADLGVDPGDGSQAFEATDFVHGAHRPDPSAHLLIWQAGSIGNTTYESTGYDLREFPALVAKLLRTYPARHPVTLYEASFDPRGLPRTERVPLAWLDGAMTTLATTLHVPPLGAR